MLKIKNKFIIFIIFIIISIIGFGIFTSYFEKNINRDSSIVLISGKATLNNNLLELNKKEVLSIGDIVKTVGKDALAVLEWGDGSVTRLGGNSSIKIEELYISQNLEKINISFELLDGKSWSNIISFLGKGSYFKESFRDSEAAVRGTVFNVDLINEYLYVINHKVNFITSDGELIIVTEKKPLNINNFNFIKLENFIKTFKDKTWENLNNKIDKDFLQTLRKRLSNNIDELIDLKKLDIDEVLLNKEETEKLYNKLLIDYQKFNFIKPTDSKLFKIKLELKEKLIRLADKENKTKLIENTLYDFENLIELKQYDNLDSVLVIFSNNKEFLGNIEINTYLKSISIPEELKNTIFNNFDNLKGIFGNKFDEVKDLNIDLKNIKENANGLIHEGLDTLFNK